MSRMWEEPQSLAEKKNELNGLVPVLNSSRHWGVSNRIVGFGLWVANMWWNIMTSVIKRIKMFIDFVPCSVRGID